MTIENTRARVLVVDNYDSFTFNLVQAISALGADVSVVSNDHIDAASARAKAPTHVVISPGPGRPEDAGASIEIVRAVLDGVLDDARLLGVCLGHQCIGAVLGARIVPAKRLMHGRASTIEHDGRGIFETLPATFEAGRYHSLAVDAATLPSTLIISARTSDGEVMALRHESGRVDGVQFHPESLLTPEGPMLLARFLGRHETNRGAR